MRLPALPAASALCLLLGACGGSAPAPGPAPGHAASDNGISAPETTYHVYVGAESADLLHRITLGPDGAAVAATVPVGEVSVEIEGPHGLNTSPDGDFIYMTTGHGVPDGKLWKIRAGADTLVADPILLGWFPATLDLTPDGLYAFVANFNLHGDPVPSTISVVYTPAMLEVRQIETCVMPHGLRVAPDGTHLYTNCMMDDLVVEIDTRSFEVSRAFRVAEGREGPAELPARHAGMAMGSGAGGMVGMEPPTCSPTWAEPSADGTTVYVACNKASRILEIDRESWSLTRVIRTSQPGPYNLEATADGRFLVATLKPSDAVEVYDLERGEAVGKLPTSSTIPHGVVASPDSRYAFVSVEGVGAEAGKVDVFSLEPFQRVASLAVGQQAGGITFWKMEPAPGLPEGP